MAGRPTKYKPEYCDFIYEKMKIGASKTQVAAMLKVDRTSFDNWVETYPEFAEAMALAEQAALAYYETQLDLLTQNPDLKSVAPLKVLEFLMASRFKKDYAKTSIQHQEITVNQIHKLSNDDLDAQIQRLLPQYAQRQEPDAVDGEIVE